MNNKQQVIIMRGASGSGKSTIARLLQPHLNAVIVSADDLFTGSDGVYRFDPYRLSLAHEQCWERFKHALDDGLSVIVDNTNASVSDALKYINAAQARNIKTTVIEIKCPVKIALARNIHGVPEGVIQRHNNRLMSDIRGHCHTLLVDGTHDLTAVIDSLLGSLLSSSPS